MIAYGRHSIDQHDLNAVIEVLQSDFLTQGLQVPAFETAMADYCNAKYTVAANSATSCLHLACLALGLKPGDSVWTSPNTFVASANCALYCGATVDFVDIDPSTYNLCPIALQAKLKTAAQHNRLPKIIIAVHFSGQSCDMIAIAKLAQQYGIKIIEDASHAVGAVYNGKPIGGCQYSDITVFSFHPVKIITTGEGGMALTNNQQYANSMSRLRSHGITKDPQQMQGTPDGDWYYQQLDLGFNYRMTDMQAALGLSQLGKLDIFLSARRRMAQLYAEQLGHIASIQVPLLNLDSSWHLYVIQLADKATRNRVFDNLRAKNIGVHVHYIPVHMQPYYQKIGFKIGAFPIAEAYYQKALTIPLHPSLQPDDTRFIMAELIHAVAQAV